MAQIIAAFLIGAAFYLLIFRLLSSIFGIEKTEENNSPQAVNTTYNQTPPPIENKDNSIQKTDKMTSFDFVEDSPHNIYNEQVVEATHLTESKDAIQEILEPLNGPAPKLTRHEHELLEEIITKNLSKFLCAYTAICLMASYYHASLLGTYIVAFIFAGIITAVISFFFDYLTRINNYYDRLKLFAILIVVIPIISLFFTR